MSARLITKLNIRNITCPMSAIEMGGGWHFHLKGRKSGKFVGGVLVLQQLYWALLVLQQCRLYICHSWRVGTILFIQLWFIDALPGLFTWTQHCLHKNVNALCFCDLSSRNLLLINCKNLKFFFLKLHLFVKKLLLNFLWTEISHTHLALTNIQR